MDQRGLDFIKNTLEDKYSYRFKWLGRPFIQMPQDMLAIQEIIWDVRPEYVIETGIAHGGGLVFYASILESLGRGQVVGIDIDIREHNRLALIAHQLIGRIQLLLGDSVHPTIVDRVKGIVGTAPAMVILDSNHTHEHVLAELNAYKDIVSVGSYMIVMDTVVEYLPDYFPDRPWDKGNNPYTAVQEFLKENKNYEADLSWDKKLIITNAPGGYLRRVE